MVYLYSCKKRGILVLNFLQIPLSAKFSTIFRFQDALFSPSVKIEKKLYHDKNTKFVLFR